MSNHCFKFEAARSNFLQYLGLSVNSKSLASQAIIHWLAFNGQILILSLKVASFVKLHQQILTKLKVSERNGNF